MPGAGLQEYFSAGTAPARSVSFFPTLSTSAVNSARNPVGAAAGSAPHAEKTVPPKTNPRTANATIVRLMSPSFFNLCGRGIIPQTGLAGPLRGVPGEQ